MEVIKLKFNLKQITPMIHFQDESGATIRVTELKPKLDRFILSWIAYDNNIKYAKHELGEETKMLKKVCEDLKRNTSKDQPNKDWLIDDVHCALNYKMRIKAENENTRINRKDITYGNAAYIVRGDKQYKASFYKDIIIECICFNYNLANKIIELLPILIDSTAFGLQQSKGYGNFRVVEIQNGDQKSKYKDDIETNLFKLEKHFKIDNILVYKLELNRSSKIQTDTNYTEVLNAIAEYNRFLKSGINDGYSIYYPSVIMKKYFKPDIINEKKAMKIKLKLANYNINNLIHHGKEKLANYQKSLDENKVYYTRGLLGFAQVYQFKLDTRNWKKFNVSGKIGNEKISRFPSPLHYHVEESFGAVYIIVNNNAVVSLQKSNPEIVFQEKNNKACNFTTKIPNQNLFNFKDFFLIAGLNNKLTIKNRKHHSREYFLTKLGDDRND